MSRLRYWFTAWRFRRLTKPYHDRIREAQRRHQPVQHIRAELQAAVHDALRGAR